MNKKLCIVLCLVAALLCGCDNADPTISSAPTTVGPETTAEVTVPETSEMIVTEPIQEPTQEVTESTAALHSELYLPDYTPEQVMMYFEEVVLNMEYSDGAGDVTLVQKWLSPICYRIYGTPTDTDLAVLEDLFDQLNAIAGFPGIYAAAEEEMENLSISFLEPDAFEDSFSAVVNGEYAFGAAQFWYYTATNDLHTARIGYRTDIEQSTRNSILIEEIINCLGITDTVLREDSIVYQYSDANTALSDMDLLILKLLYDPSIHCGMNADDCRAILETLYY